MSVHTVLHERIIRALIIWAFLHASEGARILVFLCTPIRSHHIVIQPVITELARRGHVVDYYTHQLVADPPKNFNQIFLGTLDSVMKKVEEEIDMNERLGRDKTMTGKLLSARRLGPEYLKCHDHPEVQKLFASNTTYDLVIGQFFFFQEQYAVLMHKFKTISVVFSSLPDMWWVNEMSGLPDNPSYMTSSQQLYSGGMTFIDRLENTLTSLVGRLIEWYYVQSAFQSAADKFLRYEGWESRPSLLELSKDVALILVNSHYSIGYPYPRSPHLKEIMGTNVLENPEPLPKDLQSYMDSAKHGVVFFSLGSFWSVRELRYFGGYVPLINVLKNLKQKVIWKWTSWADEEMPNIPNIKMVKWAPQQSILRHKKIKLFITHGGLGSSTEAVWHGVPMVFMPLLGDQHRNADILAAAGMGVVLDFFKLTEEAIQEAVHEVLENPTYKEAAMKISTLFRDRPMKPVQEAVYWVEYVLKYGKVLQPPSVRMPFYQLYLLDVAAFLLAAMAGIFISCCKFVSFVVSLWKSRAKPSRRCDASAALKKSQ